MVRTQTVFAGIALAICACSNQTNLPLAGDAGVGTDSAITMMHDSGSSMGDRDAVIDGGNQTGADSGNSVVDAGSIDDNPADARERESNRVATELCDCFYMDEGFATVADCLTVVTPLPQVWACERAAYDEAPDDLEASVTCEARRMREIAECYEAAECDESALEACEAEDCPSADEAVMNAFFEARDACIAAMIIGEAGTCPEGDLVTATGAGVFSGTTIGAGNDSMSECGGESAADRSFRWAAPAAGTYVFDTIGSLFDTILYVRASCNDEEELDCNDDDDVSGSIQSRVTLTMTAGQEVVVVIDAYGSEDAGNFVVNINLQASMSDGGMPMP